MACVHPLPAWRGPQGDVSLRDPYRSGEARGGKWWRPLSLPCGSCLTCRMSRAREWAVRCTLELSDHDAASWCTLTYDDEHLPVTLQRAHLSAFFKRLRARLHPHRVRFFGCGEYGERTQRPHYHAILYGVRRGDPRVQASWTDGKGTPLGFARSDALSPAAISYVAGYTAKKVGYVEDKSERIDYSTGEVYVFQPPFLQMSRRPGIGGAKREFWRSWRDTAIAGDLKIPVPRFLHQAWKAKASQWEIAQLEDERQLRMIQRMSEDTRSRPDQLAATEAVAVARHNLQSSRRKL